MSELNIRHYQPSDMRAVLDIAADTAFFGEPVEAFLEDRRLYGDAFAQYYLEHEAPFAWVADGGSGVLGFLFGCIDTRKQAIQWRRHIITNVLVRALTGRYKLGRRTAQFAWGMLLGSLRGEEPAVDIDEFPAHLQIDISQGYRGMGLGKRLLEAYLEQLRQIQVMGVHLSTTSHNETACRLYEKVGFRLLDSRPNRFWSRQLGMTVDNRTYGRKI